MGNCSVTDNRLFPSEINLKHFSLRIVIGKGGFGEVWKALNVYDKKYYAMKVMSKAKIINCKSVKLIMDERRLLSLIESP